MGLTDTATIVDPQGIVVNRPTIELSAADAQIIRAYERLLKRHGLQRPEGVGVYCAQCWEAGRSDGTRYFIEPDRIWIECRCKVRVFHGSTIQ